MILAGRIGDVNLRGASWTPEQAIAMGKADRVGRGIVSARSAFQIPLFDRAVRIAAEAVASLGLRVWRGKGLDRREADSSWQAKLFSYPNESQSEFEFWDVIESSMTARRNAYAVKIRDSAGRVVEWYAMHPDQVEARIDGTIGVRYRVYIERGGVDPFERGFGLTYDLSPGDVVHWKGPGALGMLVAPSPVELFMDTLSAAVGRTKAERSVYERGFAMKLAVEFPDDVSPEQGREWRDLFMDSYAGVGGDPIAVIGSGGKLSPISMSLRDASFVEAAGIGTLEIARMMGIYPGELLEAVPQRGSQPALWEEVQQKWLRFGVEPRLRRLEGRVNADPDFFSSAMLRSGFQTDGMIRGDLLTEATIRATRVQTGQLLVDEARAEVGLPPLPPSNGIEAPGSVPQIVPVGGAPNPGGTPVIADPSTTDATRTVERVVLREVVERESGGVVVHVDPTPIQVNVAAPRVRVDGPLLPAPVNVVNVAPSGDRRIELARDMYGNLIGGVVSDG